MVLLLLLLLLQRCYQVLERYQVILIEPHQRLMRFKDLIPKDRIRNDFRR